jgi:translation initiation factor 4G
MSVQIRQADANDADFLARIMLLAGRSHLTWGGWEIFLDAAEQDCLVYLRRLTLAKARSFAHYSRFIVAELENCPASALCGYDPRDASINMLLQAMEEVAQELSWSEAESEAFGQRLGLYATCHFKEAAGTWVIENVATLPEFRRRGLMNVLLQRILEIGRKRGYKVAQVSMDIGNLPAQRAYEKAGFRVVNEKRHKDFERVFGMPGRQLLLCGL